MKIALPLVDDGSFSLHFGGSSKVALFEVDPASRTILSVQEVVPPEAEPCEWGSWLAAQKVELVLAGGMGRGAQKSLTDLGLTVVAGMPEAEPRALVQAWLEQRASAGRNGCEGGHRGDCGHGEHGGHHCHCSG